MCVNMSIAMLLSLPLYIINIKKIFQKIIYKFFLANISRATFPRVNEKVLVSVYYYHRAREVVYIYRSVSQFAPFTVRSVRAFLTRPGERATRGRTSPSIAYSYECNERLSCEIYSIGARDCRGRGFSSRVPRVLVSTYVHAKIHTRRQINRTVTTVTLSQRRKCIIMHCETCARFQSTSANLWRIEIAFSVVLSD